MPGQNSAGLPVTPVINPLNAADQDTLEAVLAKAREIHDLIERAAHVGVDVTNHRQRNQMHVDVANRLKEMFFPQMIGSAIQGQLGPLPGQPAQPVDQGAPIVRQPTMTDAQWQALINQRQAGS